MIDHHKITLLFFSVVLATGGISEQIHKDIDKAVEGVIKGGVEVTGTPVDAKDVTFLLITGRERSGKAELFDKEKVAGLKGWLFFLIHGWIQDRSSCPWYEPLTKVLSEKYLGSRVVQIDWGKPAKQKYADAVFSTKSVGKIIAKSLQELVQKYNFPLQKIILIGHSLGGQILGWIGKEYRKLTNQTLPRLIALDPAGPIFDVRPDSRRLNKNDAEVVIVVHTDRIKFGFPSSCGTVDFFPNGGADQPGCEIYNMIDLKLAASSGRIFCSHRRAYEYYIQAIKHPHGFIAKNYMNRHDELSLGDWKTTETGSFFVETTGVPPFIKGPE